MSRKPMPAVSYKTVLPDSIQLTGNNIRPILTIHLLYSALAATIFAPLIGIAGRLLLQLSGKPMLSDFDIAWFILSPAGMMALILFASLLVTILVFEQTSLMALLYAHLHKKQFTAITAIAYTVANSRKILFFALHLVLRLLLITLPFIALSAVIAWLLINDYDINYYLTAKPPVFLLTVAIIVILLLIMINILIHQLFKWSLSLPILLFSDTPASKLFVISAKQILGYKKDLFISLILWAALSFIVGSIILGFIHFIGSLLAPNVLTPSKQLIFYLGAVAICLSLANFLITTCSSGIFTSLLMLFYKSKSHEVPTSFFKSSKQKKRFIATPLLLAILFTVSGTALWSGFHPLNGMKTVGDIQIIAHRGAAGKAPENTMASFSQAIKDGSDWLELDVQETIDGKVIVLHDSDYMKLAGVNKKIWNISYQQTQKIDIGSWFDKKFLSERTPTLAEVLELAKGKTKVLIELKYYGHTEKLEQRVIEVVEQAEMTSNVAIMSLKLNSIQDFQKIRSQWQTGLLTTKAIGKISAMEMDFMAINMAAATPAFIRSIHNAGKDVYVWTVNEQLAMFRMMSLGVDGIITDEPELAVRVRTKFMELSSIQRLAFYTMIVFNKELPDKVYRDNSS